MEIGFLFVFLHNLLLDSVKILSKLGFQTIFVRDVHFDRVEVSEGCLIPPIKSFDDVIEGLRLLLAPYRIYLPHEQHFRTGVGVLGNILLDTLETTWGERYISSTLTPWPLLMVVAACCITRDRFSPLKVTPLYCFPFIFS